MSDSTTVTGFDISVAILGAGVMGETLLAAILAAGMPKDRIAISERREEQAARLRDQYGVAVGDSVAAVAGADVVLVVVKPTDVFALVEEISGELDPNATLVSLAAGITIESLETRLPAHQGVVRAMPNTPALIGAGMFGISPNDAVSTDRLGAITQLLTAGGKVEVVPESAQDAVTAVSGSGPAYVFYLAEAMIAGGISAGLEPQTARTLTNQTILGAAQLLAESADDATELRRKVTSPNGTTHAAITTFDEHGVGSGLQAGVLAAAARSAALSHV